MSRNVLLPVDGSENSQRAFDYYLEQIRRPDDHLHLVHVQAPPHLPSFSIHEPLHLPSDEWRKLITDQVERTNKITTHYEMLCEEAKIPKTLYVGHGEKSGEAICRYAEEKKTNMIIMGSRGLNAVRRTFLGSVSDYVIHHCHIPVLVVPPPTAWETLYYRFYQWIVFVYLLFCRRRFTCCKNHKVYLIFLWSGSSIEAVIDFFNPKNVFTVILAILGNFICWSHKGLFWKLERLPLITLKCLKVIVYVLYWTIIDEILLEVL